MSSQNPIQPMIRTESQATLEKRAWIATGLTVGLFVILTALIFAPRHGGDEGPMAGKPGAVLSGEAESSAPALSEAPAEASGAVAGALGANLEQTLETLASFSAEPPESSSVTSTRGAEADIHAMADGGVERAFPVAPDPVGPTFTVAFAQARALVGPAGTFQWRGRRYTTELAEERAARWTSSVVLAASSSPSAETPTESTIAEGSGGDGAWPPSRVPDDTESGEGAATPAAGMSAEVSGAVEPVEAALPPAVEVRGGALEIVQQAGEARADVALLSP